MSDEAEYELVMPFVACASEGGPYEDVAFVAGIYLGQVMQWIEDGKPSVHHHKVWCMPSLLVPQLDLLAMKHALIMETYVYDENPDWTYVVLK